MDPRIVICGITKRTEQTLVNRLHTVHGKGKAIRAGKSAMNSQDSFDRFNGPHQAVLDQGVSIVLACRRNAGQFA